MSFASHIFDDLLEEAHVLPLTSCGVDLKEQPLPVVLYGSPMLKKK